MKLPFSAGLRPWSPAFRGSGLRGRLAALLVVFAAGQSSAAEERLEYNRDIRPILFENCFACHGPDSASRKADLRLDQRDAAVDMAALVPGKPDESEMIRRILSTDEHEVMPPRETKKSLTAAQKQTLVRWVKEGAEYQLHWSFIPPKRPEPPGGWSARPASRVDSRSESTTLKEEAPWVRNPIDSFVLARLEAAGLEPAPEADRRTIARRVSLDLTGLPPSPELVEAFVHDTAPNAYEALVDKLLDSPAWGEHRGRYWLDYARYADTHGIHFDNYREMYSYRDWVIDAFNRNLPYDQFTIESLAGDLLPNATLEQQIASGFNRCNMTTNEGGIIDEEYLVLYTRDRTETTAQLWLGLTAGCAVCHTHKFDPLTQREFYEMAAFFNNTTQRAKDGNVKDTPPIVMVPKDEDRARWNELAALIPQARTKIEARRQAARPDFDTWLGTADAADLATAVPTEGLHLAAPLAEGTGTNTRIHVDGKDRDVTLARTATWQEGPTTGSKALQPQGAPFALSDVGDFEHDQPFSCAAWVKLAANDSHGAIAARMDNAAAYRGWDFWVEQRRIGTHIVHSWPNAALKVVSQPQVKGNEWTHVAVTYDGSGKAAGVKVYYNGQPQPVNVENDKLAGSIKTDVPFKLGQRNTGAILSGAVIQELRVYEKALTPVEVETLARATRFSAILAKPASERTDAEKNELYGWWLGTFDEPFQSLTQSLKTLEQEEAAIKARGTIAHVMQEKNEPATAYVLDRGEYDQRREQVTADTPDVLPPFPDGAPRNRLGFAKWLLLPDHPLTARVTVNRYWQEVFGTGLVKTAGDFGVSGELPSHPELLDWLAVDFRESGWDVKRLFKQMVMSATYRQSAVTTPAKLEKDPANRLLSRGPRFRMDAEMVRDYALAASGLLVPKLGGPSVKPYQPPGVWEAIAMNVSNTRSYERGSGADLYRRSLYTFWKRMAPPAAMDIFNAPNRELCVVTRERTNTPLQALVTLNGDQFIEAARHLATRALKSGDAFEARLKTVSLRLLAREFRPEEVTILRTSHDDLLAYYKSHPDDARKVITVGESKPDESLDAPTLAAWTMLCNQVMNLDEVLNK